MKYLIFLKLLIINSFLFGQTNADSTTFSYLCENKYGVDFKIYAPYFKTDYHRAFIPTYNTYSCLPYFFSEALINKNNLNHYIIYFEFNGFASSKNDFKILKKENPDFDKNKNYLCGSGKLERDKGLINIYSIQDLKKFNADSILCMRVDSLARVKNDPELNDFIYVVAHKQNIGDLYVCFAYKKEYELEVIDEIKKLWKLIRFK